MNTCMEAEMDGDMDGWVKLPVILIRPHLLLLFARSGDLPVKGSLEGS